MINIMASISIFYLCITKYVLPAIYDISIEHTTGRY